MYAYCENMLILIIVINFKSEAIPEQDNTII